MNREECIKVRDLLGDIFWQMENILDYHGEEDYRAEFLSLRIALSEVRSVTHTLMAPVGVPVLYLLTGPLASLIEPRESLVVQIRAR